jgi:anti-sigma regulatory factor (Ser/Thr protein kinase)
VPQPTSSPFRHDALLYADDATYLEGTLPFIRTGLASDERILVAVGADKIRLLRSALGDDAEGVRFADMAHLGANPARIIPAWLQFAGERRNGVATPVRGIGEPIWAGRSDAELVECQRHEALLNLAFADATDFHLLCPYDTTALGPDVIEEAHASHPRVVEDGIERESAGCLALEAIAVPFDVALPDPPAGATGLCFVSGTLAAARRFVAGRAAGAGLGEDRVADLVLAVGEIAGNSLRHGGGEGVLRIWDDGEAVVAEIADRGRIADPLVGRVRPAAAQIGGWGMWIANQLCDLVQVRSHDAGTIVRLHMRLG